MKSISILKCKVLYVDYNIGSRLLKYQEISESEIESKKAKQL